MNLPTGLGQLDVFRFLHGDGDGEDDIEEDGEESAVVPLMVLVGLGGVGSW